MIYLLVGESEKINFYIGIAKNFDEKLELDVDDVALQILKPNLEGNFRGSKLTKLSKDVRKKLKNNISEFKYLVEIEGVPNLNEESEKFQGIERLVDVMFGDEFALMIIANPLTLEEIKQIERDLFRIYDKLSPFAKKTIQKIISKQNQDVVSNVNSTSINTS